MKPKHRTVLGSLQGWSVGSLLTLHRMAHRLRLKGKELPCEFDRMRSAVDICLQGIEGLQAEVQVLYESDALSNLRVGEIPLSEDEIGRLLALNRQLMGLSHHLRSVANDVTPRLDAKVADPNDPMVDYEIEVRLDYQLREDDPEHDEDDDNYLTTRTESLKHACMMEREDFADPSLPAGLLAEPHCWLFHDLYDHDQGPQSPRLSLRDCLRIGHIWVDVQVWQQYLFDAQGEPPCQTKRRWREDRG